MKIEQVSTSACETIYNADGHILRLWVSFGRPFLSFLDYTFRQEYPIKDKKWDVDFFESGKFAYPGYYPHQDPKNPQGPEYNILPNGKESIVEFLKKTLPMQQLRQERYRKLPYTGVVRSTRKHDKEEHTFTIISFDLLPHRFGPVTTSSVQYCGRCDDRINILAHPTWVVYRNFINPIFDSGRNGYEELTEQEFEEMLRLLGKLQDIQK